MIIASGNYKAKAVKDSIQTGETEKGVLQIAINLDVKDAEGKSIGEMTTFLYFSPESASYSYERLGLLGWKGKGPDDIDNLDGIDANEVDVIVKAPEQYKANDGTMKTGTAKIEILTGGGKVTLNKPLDKNTFKARLKAVGGPATGGAPPAAAGTKPPF